MNEACISCENARELLVPYFAGTLNDDGKRVLLAHLARCPDCRREAAEVCFLSRAARALAEPMPDGVRRDAYALLPERAAALSSADWLRLIARSVTVRGACALPAKILMAMN